jgi:hypothetical protein
MTEQVKIDILIKKKILIHLRFSQNIGKIKFHSKKKPKKFNIQKIIFICFKKKKS